MEQEKRYSYSFSVWPDETWDFPKSIFRLFEMLKYRVEDEFSEIEFERYRSDLSHHGLTLREVTRVLKQEPETVA